MSSPKTDPEKVKLGHNLRVARTRAGLIQEEAGAKVGLSKQSISLQESGKFAPSEENLTALSELYGVPKAEVRYGDLGGRNGQVSTVREPSSEVRPRRPNLPPKAYARVYTQRATAT